MWKVAQRNVLADNFLYAAFGGSFLNHQWLICACSPIQTNPNDNRWSVVDPVSKGHGTALTTKPTSPASALDGPPQFVSDGALTPQSEGQPYYAVNTSQPPYQPSGNAAPKNDATLADPTAASTIAPLTAKTIGDVLSEPQVHVDWAWYAGAWQDAIDNPSHIYAAPYQFQPHHQAFNYYTNYAPGTQARADHLRDGGINGVKFIADIDAGKLPAVTFYKPQGSLNEHPGYADVLSGDQHIADVISHLQKSPQWKNMLIIVTYDENGGFWDHVSPPKGDRWGPGNRIPTIIVSPYAKAGKVDHTPYDTTSILRFIIKRFVGSAHKPVYPGDVLPGIADRDRALKANGFRRPGDLTNALYLDEGHHRD
jgi:phospholipase C